MTLYEQFKEDIKLHTKPEVGKVCGNDLVLDVNKLIELSRFNYINSINCMIGFQTENINSFYEEQRNIHTDGMITYAKKIIAYLQQQRNLIKDHE